MNVYHRLSPIGMAIFVSLYGSSFSAYAEDEAPPAQEVMVVVGSGVTLEHIELEQLPKTNPTLSELLKHQPRIGINDAQTSMQGGTLRPDEISLSGARPHETKYTIGGVGVNNITTFANQSDLPTELSSGHSSGYFVDTTLIDSVEVFDHDISAEHGGFTGGVINVELRQPKEKFTVDYSYRMNDSAWNAAQKVGKNFQDSYGTPIDGSGKYQPNFQKRMHALHMSGAISETQQLALNISRQESDIPLANSKDVDQSMNNLFITHIWQRANWKATTDFRYAYHQSNHFMNDALNDKAAQENSESTNKHQGIGGSFKLEHASEFGIWKNAFAYDRLVDERASDANYFKSVFKRENGELIAYNQGGYGDLTQEQDSYQLKSTFYATPIYFGETEHLFTFGAELNQQKGQVVRPNEHMVYQYQEMVPGNPKITKLTRYSAADYHVSEAHYGLFAENNMQWHRWGMKLGGRVDRIGGFDRTVFSPRITTRWDFDLEQTNRITLGANRYYSTNLLGWALKAEQNKYQSAHKNCTPLDGNYNHVGSDNLTCLSSSSGDALSLRHADVPYADEISASWAIDVSNVMMKTVYVYRKQRDGITYSKNANDGMATLHNNLKSDDQIISLEISTIRPYAFIGGEFNAHWQIAHNRRRGYGDIKANYDQSNDLGGGFQDEWVLLDGELIRYSTMDVSGYQSPIKSSLDLMMHWRNLGVVWNNRINYQQGKKTTAYEGMKTVEINGQSETVNSLVSQSLDDLMTWDMSVNWTPTQLNNHLVLGLSATNLLNTQKVISSSGIQLGNVVPNEYYNQGRQVWFNISLRN